ncbi:MAG: lysylphosphatidylglycerol synthase transmembrane domain-containing protein [Terriglobia bacterium]
MTGSLRRSIETVAAVAVGGWVVHRMPVAAVLSSWRHLDAGWLLCALGASLTMLTVRSAKWSQLLTDSGQPRNTTGAVRSLLGSYALGTITPGRLGDLARCAFVSGSRRADVLQLTVLDRMFDMAAVVTFGAASIFLFFSKVGGLLALCLWAAFCVWVSRRGLGSFEKLGWLPQRVRRSLHGFGEKLRGVQGERYLGWALAASALDLLTLFFLLRAFHAGHLVAAIVAYPLLTMATGLPVSFGGLGPREGLSAWIFASFSVSTGAALNISLLFFAFTLLVPSLVGGVWIVGGGAASWISAARQKVNALRPRWESLLPAPDKVIPTVQRELD